MAEPFVPQESAGWAPVLKVYSMVLPALVPALAMPSLKLLSVHPVARVVSKEYSMVPPAVLAAWVQRVAVA